MIEQKMKARFDTVVEEIAELQKVLDNPKTKLTVYFRANKKQKDLEAERDQLNSDLVKLITP